MKDSDKAALGAIEVIVWQLVTNGVVPAEPLAAELERYAGFAGDSAGSLRTLAHVARAAAFPSLVVISRQDRPRWDRRSEHHR